MSFPSFSVQKPITITMTFVGILILGVIAFRFLPVEMMPNVSFGDITINIDVRGGIPASEVEKRIAKPIEEAVGNVSHLKNILSISKEGNATVILEFEPGINMDFAALEVREKFNRIRNKLPAEIEKPVIAKYEYMDVPVMVLAVTSDIRSPEELRKIVDEQIKDRIQRIEGVARAEVAGGREGKILIEVDQARLQAYNLSISNVVDTISLNNTNMLAGEIKQTYDKYLVRTIGELKNLADIENLAILNTKQGSIVRLKDVATVKNSYLEANAYARVNSQPVVSIYVQKESNANTVKISQHIQKELKSLKKVLDPDIKITPTLNQAETIEQAVNQVKTSLMHGAFLAVLVLMVFLRDVRLVTIIASSIPISVLFTFFLMYASKLTLNIMTLSGLALGVGMLVDNSIVVLDQIFKRRDEIISSNNWPADKTAAMRLQKETAIAATDEVQLAIVASTFTHVIVFVPLVFINPEIRGLYSGIALTITYSLCASLFAALTQVPLMMSRFSVRLKKPKPPKEESEPREIAAVSAAARLSENIEVKEPLRPSAGPPHNDDTGSANTPPPEDKKPRVPLSARLIDFYKKSISVSLSLRYLILILFLLGFSRVVQEARKLEREFIGIAEQNKFTIFVELPTGTKIEITDKIVKKVEDIAGGVAGVRSVTSKVEPWSGKVYVELQPLAKRKKSSAQIIEEIRPSTENLDPAFVYFEEQSEVGTKEIILDLYGYDYDIMKKLAMQVAQALQSIPKLTDVKIRMREGRPEVQLVIDKLRAQNYGLTVSDVALTVHSQMRGLVATRYHGSTDSVVLAKEDTPSASSTVSKAEEDAMRKTLQNTGSPTKKFYAQADAKEIESIVRLQEKFRKTFRDVHRLNMSTPERDNVSLEQISDFKMGLGPSEIWRKNKSRVVQVSANTGGMALGTAADKVREVLANAKFPKDYFWEMGGNYQKMMQNQKELNSAIFLSLILVYMILASLFESFSQPFIIMMTVPMAAIGAIIALRITNKPVGTGVLIGGIMLGGIVVNNSIILIHRINILRHKKSMASLRDMIITASYDRLRPIIMTALTTILGLVPMAMDKSESSNLWSPLAITVIGGLSVSTFLTLFLIPCIYLIFRDLRLVHR